mgnify:CR=1 FL=1
MVQTRYHRAGTKIPRSFANWRSEDKVVPPSCGELSAGAIPHAGGGRELA